MRNVVWAVLCLVVLSGGVTACGSSSNSGGGGVGPALGDLTVEGQVVFFTGAPAANIAVIIAGRGPFVSNGAGKFVVENVPVPYDAIVFDGPGGGADVWHGLTRPDPVFTTAGPVPITGVTSSVDGKVSGGAGLPVPANHATDVTFGAEEGLAFSSATPNSVTGLYNESSLVWFGPPSTTLHITALQWSEDLDGLPVTFTGYGSISGPIIIGDTLMNQDIVMGPLATTTISGTVTVPPGMFSPSRSLILRLPGNGFMILPSETSPGPNFSLKAPEIAGVERTLLVPGVDPMGNKVFVARVDLPAPTTNLAVSVPTATGLVFPVDGVTGVGYGTDFQVTPSPGDRVFSALFRPSVGPGPEIRLHTTESSFRIPDLSAYGLGLPAGATYSWSTKGIGPASTIDDAAVPQTLLLVFPLLGGDDTFTAQSNTWDFTFGP